MATAPNGATGQARRDRAARRPVLLISNRSPWFGAYSGYEQVGRYLSDRCSTWWVPSQKMAPLVRRIGYQAGLLALGMDRAWGHVELEAMWRVLRDRPRLLHLLYADEAPPVALRFARRRQAALVATVHAAPERLEALLRDHSFRITAPMYDHLVTITTAQRDVLLERFPHLTVEYIPHGVDCTFFRPASPDTQPPMWPIFVAIGQAHRDLSLLRAVAQRARTALPDARLVVWTSDVLIHGDWPETATLLTEQLTDTELRSLYQSAVASLFLAKTASAHNAVVESLACSVPVIATDCAANRDYVDASTGWLVGRSVDAVVQAMAEALEQRCLAPRREAARSGAQSLAWPRIAARLETLPAALP